MWTTEAWKTQNRLSKQALSAEDFLSPGLPLSPMRPKEAEILVDGPLVDMVLTGDGPSGWIAGKDGLWADQKSGDMKSRKRFGDIYLHAEWLSPSGGIGQMGGNGGIKIQGRYELQVLNSPGVRFGDSSVPQNNEAGAIYLLAPSTSNASFGPGVWQTYDVWFKAARWEGNKKTANARMTVFWNGVKVHDDVEVPGKTGASPNEAPGEHELMLQAHALDSNGKVGYRNVYVVRNPWESGLIPPR